MYSVIDLILALQLNINISNKLHSTVYDGQVFIFGAPKNNATMILKTEADHKRRHLPL